MAYTFAVQILLTNDDGARAPGLHALARVMAKQGRVVLCAPDREKSACAHAMTLRDPLRVWPVAVEGDYEAFEVNGLPVDCVNLALTEFFPEGCDLMISGINNGPNLGWDVTYSGTVGGALEGAVNGLRSIAISMAKYVEEGPTHYATAENWLTEWMPWLLAFPCKEHSILNVNVPNIAWPEIGGTRITRMGKRIYEDRVEPREDPWGRRYFWQGGVVVMDSSEPGTDVWAVNEGFVSVTPVRLDWTDHEHISALEQSLKG
jgi:5'-nucleotidase